MSGRNGWSNPVQLMLDRHAVLLDVVLAATLTAGALWAVGTLSHDRTVAASVVSAAVCTTSVAWRRARPVPAALTAWTAIAVYQVSSHDPNGAFVVLAIVLVCYSVGRAVRGLRLALTAGYALAACTIIALDAGFSLGADLLSWGLALGPLAAGALVTHWAGTVRRLREVTARVEAEHEAQRSRAVTVERVRVARELHDVVAHGVSAMVIQAGAARMTLTGNTAAARDALQATSSAGRAALVDLRRIVGVRRRGGDSGGAAPGLGGVDQLVDQARRAGIEVSTRLDPELTPPADVELTTFRIVQEALTNVGKHAQGASVTVAITGGRDRVEVRVKNTRSPGPEPPHRTTDSGHGLLGMRERVALHGGRLRAGCCDDGGFEIVAWLPLHAATRSRQGPPDVAPAAADGGRSGRAALDTRVVRWLATRIDVVIAAAWLVALEVGALSGAHLGVARPVAGALVAAMAAVAVIRRRVPLSFLLVVGALNLTLSALAAGRPQPAGVVGTYTLVVCTYTVAAYAMRGRAVAGLTVMFAGIGLSALREHQAASYALGAMLMASAVWAAGRLVRRQRQLSEQLQAATSRLAAEQEASKALALDAERDRITRDLHELVTSLVTSMVIQADSAADLIDLHPDRAIECIAAIEQHGRQALVQMRQILGVLRHDHDPAPRQPAPVMSPVPGPQPLLVSGSQ